MLHENNAPEESRKIVPPPLHASSMHRSMPSSVQATMQPIMPEKMLRVTRALLTLTSTVAAAVRAWGGAMLVFGNR